MRAALTAASTSWASAAATSVITSSGVRGVNRDRERHGDQRSQASANQSQLNREPAALPVRGSIVSNTFPLSAGTNCVCMWDGIGGRKSAQYPSNRRLYCGSRTEHLECCLEQPIDSPCRRSAAGSPAACAAPGWACASGAGAHGRMPLCSSGRQCRPSCRGRRPPNGAWQAEGERGLPAGCAPCLVCLLGALGPVRNGDVMPEV